MSKYMQIDIRIVPFYEGSFSRCFPKLFEFLREIGYASYVEEDKSLYQMVDILESIVKNESVSEDYRERVEPFFRKAKEIKKEAREMLLSRKLDDLDKLLYQLEDLFEDLDRELSYR